MPGRTTIIYTPQALHAQIVVQTAQSMQVIGSATLGTISFEDIGIRTLLRFLEATSQSILATCVVLSLLCHGGQSDDTPKRHICVCTSWSWTQQKALIMKQQLLSNSFGTSSLVRNRIGGLLAHTATSHHRQHTSHRGLSESHSTVTNREPPCPSVRCWSIDENCG